jgi:hypothetical protein
MDELLTGISDLIKQAESLKKVVEARMIKTETDIDNIKDKEIREFLKNSLSLAKENKLNIADFITNIENKCQQK